MKTTFGSIGLMALAALNVHCSTLKGQASRGNSSVGSPSEVNSTDRRVARLGEIITNLKSVAPNLVDESGNSADRTPGLIVGVVTSEGKEVVGFGTTNIQGGSLPGGDTCFGIGSVTKVFTGLILADAVQQGLLELDGSANIHLASELQLPSDEITLRQLVTHTSGLPDYPANIRVFRDLDHDGINDSTQYNPGKNYSRQNLSD